MDLQLSIEPHDLLVVELRDGDRRTSVSVHPSRAGAASLMRALGVALQTGYGECFWPAPAGGQYWWIFTRKGDTLESIAMWTRGGATGWEHVFRATDAAGWIRDRLGEELVRVGLLPIAESE